MFVPANNDDRIVDLLKLIAKSTSIDVELAASIINAGMCVSGCMAVKPRETSIHTVYPDPVLRADMLTAIDELNKFAILLRSGK